MDTFTRGIVDKKSTKLINPDNKHFWKYVLLFRLFLALNTQTMHHPDESYQSVDVAYGFVYGGTATPWEWDPSNALRSPLFPMLYAVYFKILSMLYLDFTVFVNYGPNIINAVLLWISDVFFYNSVRMAYSAKIAKFSVFLYLVAEYPLYVLPRTLSNSFEAMLLIMSVYCYLNVKDYSKLYDKYSMLLTCSITLSFVIRNTSVIPWLIPMAWMIYRYKAFNKILY